MIGSLDGSLVTDSRAEIRRGVAKNRVQKRLGSNARARSEETPHEHRAFGYPRRTEGRAETHGRRRSALLASLTMGAVLAGVVALAATAQEADAAYPGDNGRIAFASGRTAGKGVDNPTGDTEIFAMKPDGTRVVQLTNNTAEDAQPSYSADGDEIVFTSRRDGNYEVYVMDADGSGQTRLTNNGANDLNPTISPNGYTVAYESDRSGNFEIIAQVGGFEVNVTRNPADDRAPAYSPDGSRIAFQSTRDGNPEVYVIDADGSDPKNLSDNPAFDVIPEWSPGGRKIAFSSYRKSNYEVYTMNASDGSSQKRLTRSASDELYPAFSPDGKKLAFTRAPAGSHEVYVMDANGSNPVRLTNNGFQDFAPDWQPLTN